MPDEQIQLTKIMLEAPPVVDYGVERIAAGCRKYRLKREISDMFGGAIVPSALYEEFLRKCERQLMDEGGITKDIVARRLVVFLSDAMSDLREHRRDRLSAAKLLAKVSGVYQSTGVSPSDAAAEIRNFVNTADGCVDGGSELPGADESAAPDSD